jgi:hypothetical protein
VLARIGASSIVKRAGHMLTVTHPAEVNAFIEAAMSSSTPAPHYSVL